MIFDARFFGHLKKFSRKFFLVIFFILVAIIYDWWRVHLVSPSIFIFEKSVIINTPHRLYVATQSEKSPPILRQLNAIFWKKPVIFLNTMDSKAIADDWVVIRSFGNNIWQMGFLGKTFLIFSNATNTENFRENFLTNSFKSNGWILFSSKIGDLPTYTLPPTDFIFVADKRSPHKNWYKKIREIFPPSESGEQIFKNLIVITAHQTGGFRLSRDHKEAWKLWTKK